MRNRRNLHTQIVLAGLVGALVSFGAYAADDTVDIIRQKEEIIKKLNAEIAQIDSEMLRCQKTKKGWLAATIIGGAGVVATGTAAIVQATKLNKSGKTEKTPEKSKDKTDDKE